MNPSIIRVENLQYTYKQSKGSTEALRGLSFQVRENTITGILGPNGSGKSTAFKILSTQTAVQQGDAWVNNVSIKSQAAAVRKSMGVTFQSPSLDPILTIGENLLTHAQLLGMSRAQADDRINELLRTFRLSDRKNTRVKELSGGLARRAELAKTLLTRPKILLLDEPTTGLDPSARLDFWNELRELRDGGITIVVTTHLMDEADLCDELIFMVQGRCAATGTPSALKDELKEDIITLEMDEGAITDGDFIGRVRDTADSRDKLKQDGNRIQITTSRSQDWIRELAPLLGRGLRNLNWGKATLADVYLLKTGQKL